MNVKSLISAFEVNQATSEKRAQIFVPRPKIERYVKKTPNEDPVKRRSCESVSRTIRNIKVKAPPSPTPKSESVTKAVADATKQEKNHKVYLHREESLREGSSSNLSKPVQRSTSGSGNHDVLADDEGNKVMVEDASIFATPRRLEKSLLPREPPTPKTPTPVTKDSGTPIHKVRTSTCSEDSYYSVIQFEDYLSDSSFSGGGDELILSSSSSSRSRRRRKQFQREANAEGFGILSSSPKTPPTSPPPAASESITTTPPCQTQLDTVSASSPRTGGKRLHHKSPTTTAKAHLLRIEASPPSPTPKRIKTSGLPSIVEKSPPRSLRPLSNPPEILEISRAGHNKRIITSIEDTIGKDEAGEPKSSSAVDGRNSSLSKERQPQHSFGASWLWWLPFKRRRQESIRIRKSISEPINVRDMAFEDHSVVMGIPNKPHPVLKSLQASGSVGVAKVDRGVQTDPLKVSTLFSMARASIQRAREASVGHKEKEVSLSIETDDDSDADHFYV